MGLTAKKFVVLLILAAVALVALTVWLWPRLSRTTVRAVSGRVGLLALCQLAILSAFAAAVNADFMFYTSWSDLLQTQKDTGTVRQVSHGSPGHLARTISVTGRQTVRYQGQHAVDRTGRIDAITLRGQLSGLAENGFVYLPPEYFAPGNAHRRFPVVVQLTGYPGDARALIKKLKIPQYALAGVRAGTARPTIYVMIRSTVGGRDLECTDVPGGPQDLTYLAQDVPLAVKQSYRVSDDPRGWAVAGDSTGGYCALKIAMTNPDRYTSAVSLSGYYHSLQDVTTGDLYGGSKQVKLDNDLFWRLAHLPSPPVNVLLTTSRNEHDYRQTADFAKAARAPMRVATLVRDQGGHNFNTWTQEVPHMMAWLSGVLEVPGQERIAPARPGATASPTGKRTRTGPHSRTGTPERSAAGLPQPAGQRPVTPRR